MNLERLTGVTIDVLDTALIGAGERWTNVYTILGKQGRAIMSGRVSNVGGRRLNNKR